MPNLPDKSAGIPRRLPAVAQDRMIYGCRFGQQQHANFVLAFGGRLDEQRLRKAIRLAMDAEPVFGCRYVPGPKPYWERREDLDSLPLCTVAETPDLAREIERFVATPCDETRDPLLTACIVRGESDALLVKTNHVAADGQGSKQLLALVASLYRDPSGSAQGFAPNLASRGAGRLFREIGLRECLRILRGPRHTRPKDVWRIQVANRHERDGLRFAVRRLEPDAFDALRAFGKGFGASLNEVFVAACFRALWRFFDFPSGVPQSITVPTDVRRYLRQGATEAICNFVAPLHVTFARLVDEPFEQTLIRVKDGPLSEPVRRQRAVANMLWISMLYNLFLSRMERGVEALFQQLDSEGRSMITLTNLGAFEPGQFDFGVPLTDMYRISHAALWPGLLMSVSSFRKKLTFAINYPGGAIRTEDVERFLDLFVEELMEARSPAR
jgi:NRPS condensation-like uncharacterized protein